MLADCGYDLVPAEAIDAEEIGDGIERGCGSLCEIDVVEGLEVQFADGFRFEDHGSWARGLKGWGSYEDSYGDGVFGAGAEEDKSCPSCTGLVGL